MSRPRDDDYILVELYEYLVNDDDSATVLDDLHQYIVKHNIFKHIEHHHHVQYQHHDAHDHDHDYHHHHGPRDNDKLYHNDDNCPGGNNKLVVVYGPANHSHDTAEDRD